MKTKSLLALLSMLFLSSCAGVKKYNDTNCKTFVKSYSRASDEVLKELISKGLSLDCSDQWGRNPIGMLMAFNKLNLALSAIKKNKWDINSLIGKSGQTLIFKAVYFNKGKDFETLNKLKNIGVNFKHIDSNGNSLFHISNSLSSVELFEYILTQGANPQKVNDDGLSPLMIAVTVTDNENRIVKKLLDIGANSNLVLQKHGSDIGGTALVRASYFGYLSTVKLLLERGADINLKDQKGDTALHKAVKSKLIKLTRYLLKMGADRSLLNNDNKTPLELAQTNKIKNLF